jgi:DNA-binding NtrC family response regulator
MMEYPWPGNIRELANVIDRAGTLCTADEILPCDLPEEVANGSRNSSPAQEEASRSVLISLEEGEKRQIKYVFKALGGHRGKTASMLQISRRSLYDKLKRYGIAD